MVRKLSLPLFRNILPTEAFKLLFKSQNAAKEASYHIGEFLKFYLGCLGIHVYFDSSIHNFEFLLGILYILKLYKIRGLTNTTH